jgi:hypothetical protein
MDDNNKPTRKTGKHLFQKGYDPRRKLDGRPVGSLSFTTKVRTALEKIADGKDYTNEEAFIKTILKKATVDGDPAIIRLIWNYLDGMPREDKRVRLDNSDLISQEQLDELLKRKNGDKDKTI